MSWYKWVFDGVGGGLLVALVVALIRRVSSRISPSTQIPATGHLAPTNPSSSNVSGLKASGGSHITISQTHSHNHYGPSVGPTLEAWRNSEPRPDQLYEEWSRLSPYQRAQSDNLHAGIDAHWGLRLSNISRVGDKWLLLTKFVPQDEPDLDGFVTFFLSEVPPALRTAPKGTLIWVRGKIDEARSKDVHLQDNPEIIEIRRPK